MRQKIIRSALYGVGYLLLTLIFIYWTFPTSAARDLVERVLTTKLGYQTEISSLSVNGFSGIGLKDIELMGQPKKILGSKELKNTDKYDPKTYDRLHDPIKIQIDAASLNTSLYDLLTGSRKKLNASVKIKAYDGEIKIGRISAKPGAMELVGIRLKELDFSDQNPLRMILPMDLRGQLSGNARISISGRNPDSAEVSIIYKDVYWAYPIVPWSMVKRFQGKRSNALSALPAGTNIPLCPAELGDIEIKLKIAKDTKAARARKRVKGRKKSQPRYVFSIEEFSASGGDILFSVNKGSRINFERNRLRSGAINLNLRFQFSDDYLAKECVLDPKLESDPDTYNLQLKYLMSSAHMKRFTDAEGWTGLGCVGANLKRARCNVKSAGKATTRTRSRARDRTSVPGRPSKPYRKKATRSPSKKFKPTPPDPTDDEADDEGADPPARTRVKPAFKRKKPKRPAPRRVTPRNSVGTDIDPRTVQPNFVPNTPIPEPASDDDELDEDEDIGDDEELDDEDEELDEDDEDDDEDDDDDDDDDEEEEEDEEDE